MLNKYKLDGLARLDKGESVTKLQIIVKCSINLVQLI